MVRRIDAERVLGRRRYRVPWGSPSIDTVLDTWCIHPRSNTMRTTVTLDGALLAQAQSLSGLKDRSLLLQEALRALIERESARRLIRLAGTEPQLEDIPRRRESA